MDEDELRRRLSDVAGTGVDRGTVMLGMQQREIAHARRRRRGLALGAVVCVVAVVGGGIGLTSTGVLGGPSGQHSAASGAATATPSNSMDGGRTTTAPPSAAAQASGSAGDGDRSLATATRAAPSCATTGQPTCPGAAATGPTGLKIFPTTSRNGPITKAEAEAFARRAAGAAQDAPAFAEYMTGAAFLATFGEERDANIDESRPVWVVTIRTPVRTDGVGTTQTKRYYSIVIDAITGRGTDDCIGCNWVSGSQRALRSTA